MVMGTMRATVAGPLLMVLAGLCFALVNVAIQGATMIYGLPAPTVVLWQYAIALAVCLPVLQVRRALRVGRWRWHLVRVGLAVMGVQLWTAGLAHVPIWQAIALILLSPVFVTFGAAILLRERVGAARWIAVLTGVAGGCVVLAPWSDAFTWAALYPVGAAAFWAGASLMTKRLALVEDADVLTVWLLLLLVPVNVALAAGPGVWPGGGPALVLLIGAGKATAVAQYALAAAYRIADAAYLQPFDHLKLPLNILFGFLAFGFAPQGATWIGTAMILGAGLWLVARERAVTETLPVPPPRRDAVA